MVQLIRRRYIITHYRNYTIIDQCNFVKFCDCTRCLTDLEIKKLLLVTIFCFQRIFYNIGLGVSRMDQTSIFGMYI